MQWLGPMNQIAKNKLIREKHFNYVSMHKSSKKNVAQGSCQIIEAIYHVRSNKGKGGVGFWVGTASYEEGMGLYGA